MCAKHYPEHNCRRPRHHTRNLHGNRNRHFRGDRRNRNRHSDRAIAIQQSSCSSFSRASRFPSCC
jgi:hypothetical protein